MDFFENDTVENNLKIPYNIEAEEALLGSIFVRPDIISDVLEKIGVDDFYKNNHKIIGLPFFNGKGTKLKEFSEVINKFLDKI